MDEKQVKEIEQYFYTFEKFFSIFSLIFYSSSLFFLIQVDYAIAETIGKLVYHAITLLTVVLLLIHRRKLIPALKNLWLLIIIVVFVVASIFWSDAPGVSTQLCLPLIRLTLLGIYLGIRFDLNEFLSILSLLFIISGAFSIIFVLFLPQYGVMGRGTILSGEAIKHSDSWRGIYNHKNYMGMCMSLGFLSLYLTPIRQRMYTIKYL